MDRRAFVRTGVALGAAGLTVPDLLADPAGAPGVRTRRADAPDLVLRGGLLFDGTGAEAREADVAVTGDRITAVGQVAETGVEELRIDGLALAPGFIDIHSHADLALLVEPRAESRIRQGVTLEVTGQDGSSILWSGDRAAEMDESYRRRYGVELGFADLAGFFARLERTPATVNVASMVGHGSVRGFVVGGADRPATDAELRRMRGLVREALEQGAVGLSSGLEYTPGGFAPTAELVALASELRGTGLPYASHMRNEDDRLLAALEECLHVGRMAGVPVQVSHLKAQGERNYWKAEVALGTLEAARASGLDVHFDRYPYVAYATGLSNLFPGSAREGGNRAFLARLVDPATAAALERDARDKVALLGDWDRVQISSTGEGTAWARGRKLGALARERGVDPYALAVELLRANGGSVGMIGFGMSEGNTARMLAHPLGMVCSDGGAFAPYGPLSGGSPHPRAYGSFPRVLGYYVRETGALSLARAVHKMTGMPAAKLGLRDRGLVRPGAFADLVAFDPDTVADGATFETPHRHAVGIPHVVVNGRLTLRDGEQTGARAGRPIRRI
jgi:N-acyl-D-amino-acid deacylase